ncbi:MAG: Maltose/maltodextrin transporter, substrate binding periplasmic protein MalE [Firmicutes bacterium]|nr:Maltose/maltodextrin transporter, substrate binding periplasmic protein MalE [Bacillota bacterium]
MRRILHISLILILSMLLCGCRQNSNNQPDLQEVKPSATQEAKEILNFRITWKAYSGRGEAIGRIVNNYNEQSNMPYRVAIIDGDEDRAAIEMMLNTEDSVAAEQTESKTTDIDIYMLPYRYIQYFGSKNMLMDLSDEFSSEKDIFYPNLWNLSNVNGVLYGVPWMGHSMGLIYNRNLLDKAGVNPEEITDLDTLVSACESVEKSTKAMGIGLVGAEHNDISWMVNQFIYGFGGSLVSEDGLKVTINSEQSKEALSFYKDVLGSHAQSSWKTDTGVEVMDAFRSQKIAFEIQGLWGITDIWKNGNTFETGVIPLESIHLYPEVGPMMVALPVGLEEEKVATAVDFIHFLISEQAQEQITEGEYSPEKDAYYPFRLPVRKDSVEDDFFDVYPEFTKFLIGFEQPSIDVPTPLWQEVKDKYYAPGLHRVMLGQVTIDDFLIEIEEQGNKILNSNK